MTAEPVPLSVAPDAFEPEAGARFAARTLQLGAIAVVLVATTWRAFDLDRFFVAKELALHLSALLAGLAGWRAIRERGAARGDRLLFAFLVLSAASAVLATNRWLGFRGFAVSLSSVAVYAIARGLRGRGAGRRVTNGVAAAVVVAAITALLQAYGLWIDLFALTRVPGGTLGNRNFVGHVAAFGLPLLLLAALRAERFRSFLLAASGAAIVSAALVLTRSRAAWLAAAVAAVLFALAFVASRSARRSGRFWRRAAGLLVMIGGGVAAALLLPNALRWRSDNPYLESVQGVVEYDEGSGRGRLVQYQRSLLMSLAHPLFGVGPGNWPVEYPRYAAANDPSLNPSDDGMTFNPWPSSDWVAFVSERGPAAAALLALALVAIALSAWRGALVAEDPAEALGGAAALACLGAAVTAGAFDAVLLLPVPAFLVWAALGALAPPPASDALPPRRLHPLLPFAALLLIAVGVLRSGAQLTAMGIYATHGDRPALVRASQIDPGSYRLHLRLARSGRRSDRCRHARAAHALFPHAAAARNLARGCGE